MRTALRWRHADRSGMFELHWWGSRTKRSQVTTSAKLAYLLCLCGHAASSAMVSSQAPKNAAASACVKGSGGRIFTTLAKAPALLVRKPLSFSRLITRLARSVSGPLSEGLTSSTPMNRPWPRTSPIALLVPLR